MMPKINLDKVQSRRDRGKLQRDRERAVALGTGRRRREPCFYHSVTATWF